MTHRIQAMWTWDLVLVDDSSEEIRYESFNDLMNHNKNILWTGAMNLHQYLVVTA